MHRQGVDGRGRVQACNSAEKGRELQSMRGGAKHDQSDALVARAVTAVPLFPIRVLCIWRLGCGIQTGGSARFELSTCARLSHWPIAFQRPQPTRDSKCSFKSQKR